MAPNNFHPERRRPSTASTSSSPSSSFSIGERSFNSRSSSCLYDDIIRVAGFTNESSATWSTSIHRANPLFRSPRLLSMAGSLPSFSQLSILHYHRSLACSSNLPQVCRSRHTIRSLAHHHHVLAVHPVAIRLITPCSSSSPKHIPTIPSCASACIGVSTWSHIRPSACPAQSAPCRSYPFPPGPHGAVCPTRLQSIFPCT
ncbi:hypothetical protein C8R46DRAFT_252895 [Mycena filopes]|nr:hypothetical protein C8R46DRAFT_252895 [Mycena filopes]